MLERIWVRNFAVARDVEVEPGPGLNVFTGETGAGKSLIVDALAFAFGARRGREVIAAGADRAEVVVQPSGGPLVERSIGLAGRSATRVDGVVATIEAAAEVGASVEIHGQLEQIAVLRPAVQLAHLDRFAGCSVLAYECSAKVRELREVRRVLASLISDERERERRIEQLRFEVDEIRAAELEPNEDKELRQEHDRLASTAARLASAEQAMASLDASPIGDIVRQAQALLEKDPEAEHLLDAAQLLEATTTELTRIVRRYRDEIEDDPERLGVLDERLDLLGRLRRKYGDTLEDVIAYAAGASSELERLTGEGYSTERLEAREHELLATLGQETAQLSVERRGAAAGLVEAVSAELTRQGMESASLAIGFGCEDAADGILSGMPDYEVVAPAAARDATGGELVARAFSESGVDRIEFLASFNVGESPRSLGSVASGGETSRFLLALTTVLGSSAEPGTIVLDEVDEGVGGRSGALVGDALARLAEHHQVLCITHLPQVAARADSHFVVSKQTDGQLTWSEIRAVNGEDQITELAAMLGGNSDANRTAAVELLGSHEGAETRA